MEIPKPHNSHKLYDTWTRIKYTCLNKKSKYYIENTLIFDDWQKFPIFFIWAITNGWKEGLCLRRKNESIGFIPDNCFFDTKANIIIKNTNHKKSRATILRKYGVDNYTKTKEYKEKAKKTSLAKYGVEYHIQSDVVRKKIEETCRRKYGGPNPMSSKIVQQKIIDTNFKRFGCKAPSQNKEIRQKQVNTLLEKYGTVFVKTSGETEKKLSQWFTEILGEKFKSDYSILEGKEIDIYLKDYNLGIEYCGLYWHNENSKQPRDRNYHYNKYKKCLDKNVRLITIFSDEWKFRKEQVQGYIKSILGINTKIFGRKCEVELSKDISQSKNFIELHHIQGKRNSSLFFIDIKHGDELVGVMSFGKHHRKSEEICLDRLVFKNGVTIIGGASKLFKLGVQECKKLGYTKIISWSDNRWSQGDVYNKLGFELETELKPDYSYVLMSNPKKRKSKQSMKKKNIDCKEGQTEYDRAKELGYSRIWDCGKKRWVYTIR